jgi:hypothetical protein
MSHDCYRLDIESVAESLGFTTVAHPYIRSSQAALELQTRAAIDPEACDCRSIKLKLPAPSRCLEEEPLPSSPPLEPSSTRRRGLVLWDTWQRPSPPRQGGVVWSCQTHGNAWWHALCLVLTWCLYAGVPGLLGTDNVII